MNARLYSIVAAVASPLSHAHEPDQARTHPWAKFLLLLVCLTPSGNLSGQEHRPNILLIVADDLGFTDLGAYGGEIATPTLDALAAQGIRLSNFHVLPTCSPTRSVLLTGTDNHLAGLGAQQGGATKYQQSQPGYEGYLNDRVAALPEVLETEGYRTYLSGKWHLGHQDDRAPFLRGFQETFCLLPGGASHYADATPLHPDEPAVYRRNGQVVESLPDDFYSTKDYTDYLLDWLERDKGTGQPFFAYLSYTAPHDPLHAPREFIEKYRGNYDKGYEELRRTRFAQAKQLGLIDQSHQLSDWPVVVSRWADLSDEERKLKIRDMEVYAAMIDYLDTQVDRTIRWLKENSIYDNTMIVFMSDNGANGLPYRIYPTHSPEFHAQFDDSLKNRGLPNSFVDLGAGFATASTAGFRFFKTFSTEGGIRVPCIIKPTGEHEFGQINSALTHVRDLMPTFLDLVGATHPAEQGKPVERMLGKSLLPLLANRVRAVHENEGIGYELHGTRAYIKDQWKIVQMPIPLGSADWELFNLASDPAETTNLAFAHPKKLSELVAEHEAYEAAVGAIYDPPLVLNTFRRIHSATIGLLSLVIGISIARLTYLISKDQPSLTVGRRAIAIGLAVAQAVALGCLFTRYNQTAAWALLAMTLGTFVATTGKQGWLKSTAVSFAAILAVAMFLLLKSGRLVALLL